MARYVALLYSIVLADRRIRADDLVELAGAAGLATPQPVLASPWHPSSGEDDMAKFIFGMMQSLDGYVAGAPGGPELPPPGPALHQYFNDHVRGLAGCLYGRRMYEVMRYWDANDGDWGRADNKWGAVERDFATVWRAKPKWVVSRSLRAVGPKATLIGVDVEAAVRRLKAEVDGEIDVAGPELAAALGAMGLIDEYRLFLRPFVLGAGKPFFAGPRPALRLVGNEVVADGTARLTYVPG